MQQHNIADQDRNERKVRQLEATLIVHNETTERVLEACRRIQRSWNTAPAPKAETDEWQSA